LRLWRNPNFVWEPPPRGGNSGGGFQNPLGFLGENHCRGAKRRGNFFAKSNLVDLLNCNWNNLITELAAWKELQEAELLAKAALAV